MNTSSLELSKELYELSGWSDSHLWWSNTHQGRGNKWRAVHNYLTQQVGSGCYPAYDLGYLLRKLPEATHIFKNREGKDYSAWVVADKNIPTQIADTPEDACAKLCCVLIRAGIIKDMRDGR